MTGFASSWLSLREPSDGLARAHTLAATLNAVSRPDAGLEVLDLGAGLGANLRYLAPGLGGRQHWTLLDDDAELLAQIPRAMTDWARAHGFETVTRGAALDVRGPDFECRIATRAFDLSGIATLDVAHGSLITASALLDLVSGDWLDSLAELCAGAAAHALFALTYDGRATLTPEDAVDADVIELVNRHQRGDKGFGPALGPAAAGVARERFAARKYRVQHAASDWLLGTEALPLQRALLEGWRDAALELAPGRSTELAAWHARRAAALDSGELHIRVGHEDLLAWPDRG